MFHLNPSVYIANSRNCRKITQPDFDVKLKQDGEPNDEFRKDMLSIIEFPGNRNIWYFILLLQIYFLQCPYPAPIESLHIE